MRVFEFFLILRPLLALVYFGIHWSSTYSVHDRDEEFEGLMVNWRSDLIGAMSLQRGSSFDTNIWDGYFEGTAVGCDCPNSYARRNVVRGLHKHKCSYNESITGCIGVPSVPKFRIYHGLDQISIAYARIPESSFLSLYHRMNPDGTCDESSKPCGDRNSISGGICIPKEWNSCPISEISLRHSAINGTQKVTKYEDHKLWYIENSEENNPIVDLRITEDRVCLNPNVSPHTEGRTPYELWEGKQSPCQTDSRWESLFSIGEKSLFDMHNIPYNILPRYETSNDISWRWMYRRIIQWRAECKTDVIEVLALKNWLHKTERTNRYFFWINLIMIIILAILQFRGSGMMKANAPLYVQKKEAFFRLGLIGILMLAMGCNMYNGYKLAWNIENLVEKGCADEITQRMFSSIARTITIDYYLFSKYAIALWIFIAVSDNIEYFWNRMRKAASKRTEGLPPNLPILEDNVKSFGLFMAVISSFS